MEWVHETQLFLADLLRHWVGKLTGALSIVLGIVPLAFPDFFSGSKGLIHTQWAWWTASALAFFIAARAAWGEQHRRVKELEGQIAAQAASAAQIQPQRVEVHISQSGSGPTDGPPQIGMRVIQPEEGTRRGGIDGSYLLAEFKLRHLGGRLPTSIEIKPIYSARGRYSLRFEDLPYLANGAEETLRFEVWENDQPPSRKARILGVSGQRLLGEFVGDSVTEGPMSVPLVVWFRDGYESPNKKLRLLFDYRRDKFDIIDDYPPLSQLLKP